MQGGPPPCPPRRSAGGRPIGQEISKIRGGNMKQNPLKSRGLWGVREWNRKKMYPSGWKHYAWVKKTLRRTFVSLWKNCFSPFGRKNNHFFLGKQKFASEFFCPWHKVSTQKEHIYLTGVHSCFWPIHDIFWWFQEFRENWYCFVISWFHGSKGV